MEMGDHYAFADLRQLIAGRTAALFPTDEQFNGHRNLTTTTTAGTTVVGQQQHYDMLMLGSSTSTTDHHPPPPPHQILFPHPLHHRGGGGGGEIDFCSSTTHDHSTNPTTATTTNSNYTGNGTGGFCGLLEMDREGGGGGGYMHMINNIGIGGGGGGGGGGGDGGGGGGGENVHNISRWPRQETLSLLEIRSQLDPKFKEANQKGPLWDEVSRIMAEEHGYQRSGKKCREKFENLYKYYKKTKEGKAGRQDGKHYRFFRQLEALYGETSTSNHPNLSSSAETHNAHHHHHLGILTTSQHNLHQFQTHTSTSSQSYDHHHREGLLMRRPDQNKLCESLSLSNSSEFDTSSSDYNVGNDDDDDDDNDNLTPTIVFMGNDDDGHDSIMETRKKKHLMKDHHNPSHKRGKRSWKTKIRDFVDSRMKKLMETQEAWLDKMLKTLEHKEQERISREEEWRTQETARIDREHKFWAKERAWFEARDAALMEALHRFTGTELKVTSPEELMATEVHENSTENHIDQNIERSDVYSSSTTRWSEAEISSLIQLKSGLESKFQQCGSGSSQEALWEDISGKMACLGYHRSAKNFQEKCESIDNYLRKTNEGNKKRRENSRTSPYNYQHLDSTYSHQGVGGFQLGQGVDEQGPHEVVGIQLNDGPSPSNSNAGTTGNDHCFRFLMNEGENLWENYGMKLNKGGSNNQ